MLRNAHGGHDSSPDLGHLQGLVSDCLKEARNHGAHAAEAAVSHDTGLTVNVRLGEVETVEYQRDRSLGVTVFFGRHKGSASTADFSAAAMRQTVEAACRIARYTTEDPCVGLADPELLARTIPDLDLDHPWDIDPASAIGIAREAEAAARDSDTRIINSEGATCSTHRGLRVYGNTHDFLAGHASTSHSIVCIVIAGAGGEMQRDYSYTSTRDPGTLESPIQVGGKAADRAVRRLGSRKLSTRRASVVFAPETSRGLFASLLSAASGSAQYRRSSFLLGAVGQPILPSWVSVREDPLVRGGPASAAYDNEGVATRSRALVQEGILTTYLLDSYSARRLGLHSTGHSGGWTNIFVDGEGGQQELLQRMGTGLLITEMMGQGVNIVTGDYSRGASGFWVEDGAIVHPVEEITVAGNLREMMLGIQAIGADRDERHGLQVGSVLLRELAIAGD